MSDPLTDPRAAALLHAQPDEVGTLAGEFRRVASQAETSISGLRGANGDASWTGAAADAFRTQLGKLPGDLEKVHESYGRAASALSAYAGELGPLKSKLQSLVSQLHSAQSAVSNAQGHLNSAKGNLTSATSAPHTKASSPSVVNAHNAVSSAGGALTQAQGELSGLQQQAFHILDEADTFRGHARSAVSSAAGVAPSSGGWFSGMMHSIGNFMSSAGHFAVGMVKDVVHSAEALPGDALHVLEHPLDLHDWAKLGEDVGTVAGAVALVASVFICPADALGFEAFAEGASELVDGADAVAYGAGVGHMAADTGLVAEGEEKPGQLAFDAFGVATSKIDPGEHGAETDVEHLAGKSSALEQYGESRALGATHKEAFSNLSDEQKHFITKSASKLNNPGRLTYMRNSTLERLSAATTSFHRIQSANTFGHFALEKATHAVNEKVLPESEPDPTAEPALAGG
jgi:uncharacterized protein YukE